MSLDQLSLFAPPTEPVEPVALLPDDAARRRIHTDLDTNLLVEAGAGAGKTTEMVSRMVALVRSGTALASQLAAVTFTRKAAAELRERFQTSLERELRAALAAGEIDTAARLDAALREIDRAFLGTIHAFCARLLRERPLDAGLDPAFRETLGSEETRLRRQFWHQHLERLAAAGDASLAQLRDVGLAPRQLIGLFEDLTGQPDVEYPAAGVERPRASFVRRRIEEIMDRAVSQLPDTEPAGGWDKLQTSLRMLRFHRWVMGWQDDAHFIDLLAELRPSSFKATMRKWPDGQAAKAMGEELAELFEDGGAVNDLLRQWWAFRYPIVLAFVQSAAAAYERERVRAGTLNFQDLLMFAARLLRESPPARRELSDRYRFLLVDEFQDTDPIQAEVLFLLASDEELDIFEHTPGVETPREWRPPYASWRHLTPRPGALFVVGDPKQSIYRFRRADMMLYQQVKRRFESFGAVLELTSNFRSRRAVETFVNDIFRQRFPEQSSDVQARFAPMRVRPREQVAGEGVFWYELDDPVNSKVPQLAKQDSERVATLIAERIAGGDNRPGDFLLLTPNTKWLAKYASALEARNVPVQVTGAGVGGPEGVELHELRVLLRALADPGDPALTVAVLVGLFFGLDYEQLVRHTETWAPQDGPRRRAPFSFTGDWSEPATPVEEALDTLRRFWRWTREQPADIAVRDIVEELGILPFAAAGELGESRAGALLFALDAVRAAALAGDSSLAGALAALDAALDEDESEAPLEPGRGDVVRVMNLHKAKGLEARVVILAMPFGDWSPPPRSRIVRDETGRALGYVTVTERRGQNMDVTLAQPLDWDEHAAEEERFGRAEDERLLYVAATRAADTLIVGMAANPNSPSPWRSFYEWLRHHGTSLRLPEAVRGAREVLEVSAEEIGRRVLDTVVARAVLGVPTYRVAAVSDRKAEAGTAEAGNAEANEAEASEAEANTAEPSTAGTAGTAETAGLGTEWGTVVHDALEAAARLDDPTELRNECRNLLIGQEREVDAATGEPVELALLLSVIAAVRGSETWRRAHAAERMLVEVPFAVRFAAAEYAAITGRRSPGRPDAADLDDAVPVEIMDGRIDLIFREERGWVIIDYKSDAAGERISAELMRRYLAQLKLYAAAWEHVSGESVIERALLFTATGALVHAT
jgi:ATP-dependent helicase/nuclease subunit A